MCFIVSYEHPTHESIYIGVLFYFAFSAAGSLNSQALDHAVNIVRYCTFHMEPRVGKKTEGALEIYFSKIRSLEVSLLHADCLEARRARMRGSNTSDEHQNKYKY